MHLWSFLNILEYRTKVNEPFGGAIAVIFVTGGTGFVGSHTVERLLSLGHTLRCLVRPNRPHSSWLEGLPVQTVHADLTDRRQLIPHLEGAEIVVHIAGVTKARTTDGYWLGNVRTTTALIEAAVEAKTVRKFVQMSSLTAVGPSSSGKLLTEDAPCRPVTTYGRSKLEAEAAVRRHADQLATVILRPPAVYGPRDADILEMFRWVRYGIRPVIGSPRKTLSLIYGPELARAVAAVLSSPRSDGQTYHVADRESYVLKNVIREISKIAGRRTISLRFPAGLVYTLAGISQGVSTLLARPALLNIEKARDLLQPHWVCSAQKIRDELQFETAVPVSEGLRTTWEWYRKMQWL